MKWLKRLLDIEENPEVATRDSQWDTATQRWRVDNSLKRNRGCYSCGGSITKEVQHSGNMGDEPVRWFACDDHYSTLYKSVYGKPPK